MPDIARRDLNDASRQQPAGARTVPALPDNVAFWALAFVLGLFMFAASAPSPLYQSYAATWHFSPLTLTVIFALYAVALLLALLIAGRISDHLGRRPVVLASIALEAASIACFIAADGTFLLAAARILQGLATGSAIGALSAALVELSAGRSPALAAVVNSAAPTFGLAAGGLSASLLVQYGPAPMRLVYWLILAALALSALLIAGTRETGQRRPGAVASLAPRIGLPPKARATFLRAVPSLVALWALSGFYLSLAPGLANKIADSRNVVWGGAVIFLLMCSGGVAVVLCKALAARRAMLFGCIGLLAGVALTFAAIVTGAIAAFLIGSLIAGAGFGLSFMGAFRAVIALAEPSERAGTIAVIYTVSYLAFSLPIIIAGVATTHYAQHDVALVFSGCVAALAAIGTLAALPAPHLRARHNETAPPPGSPDLPPCPATVPGRLDHPPAPQSSTSTPTASTSSASPRSHSY